MLIKSFGTTILKRTYSSEIAQELVSKARSAAGGNASASYIWSKLHPGLSPSHSFDIHKNCYSEVYTGVDDVKPAWIPTKEIAEQTNISKVMTKNGFSSYEKFYAWSVGTESRDKFWTQSAKNVGIDWEIEPSATFDISDGVAHVKYFPDGRLNIVDSCFNKRNPFEAALVYSMETEPRNLREMSFRTLDCLSNQIANGITDKLGLNPGDAVGICMPMTPESIAVYLGIVKAGCVVTSIADSFSSDEIAMRCRLSNTKAVFTQDVVFRGAKYLPLFERVLDADKKIYDTKEKDCQSMKIIVLPGMLHANSYPNVLKDEKGSTWTDRDRDGKEISIHTSVLSSIRKNHDMSWYTFLDLCSEEYTSIKRSAMDPCNILFSSGTTGEPKAIVWSHSTPIKVR